MKNSMFYYSVGALLYCPANHSGLAHSIISERFGNKFSLALCLEDTIHDQHVHTAEGIMIETLTHIYEQSQQKAFYMPKIFIRVRHQEQIVRLTKALGNAFSIVTGFIIPKFSISNADYYIQEIIRVNELANRPVYMMPIYENSSIIHLNHRSEILYELKEKLEPLGELVLNIRVGGNDLCHYFGFRRHVDESIHAIRPIANIFSDIVTIYGNDYVISGPVWEYYSGPHWDEGLRQEIKEDILCGFLGKTVIHPNQIDVVNQCYQVSPQDYADAQSILNWNENESSMVSGNHAKDRMNEYKTHTNWAQKTLMLANYYGIRQTI